METQPLDLSSLFPNIAVQLRSALNTLHLAAVQLVPAAERERDPELDSRAALLDQSYYRLLRTVNNLTAAGYLGREEPLPFRDQDLVETVRKICTASQGLAQLLHLKLEFHSSEDLHICAFHRPSVEELLYQLLSNAFKFTPPGGSILVEEKASGGRVLLSVIDTGCGFREEQIPFLFDRYLHADPQAVIPHGLGLGLPICQHIAACHGGTIMAESRPGQGARFTLSLPDRISGKVDVSDIKVDYNGGFNPTLLALADALPAQAFSQRQLD